MSVLEPIEELKSILLLEDRKDAERNFDDFRVRVLSLVEDLEKQIEDPDRLAQHIAKAKPQLLEILSPEIAEIKSSVDQINAEVKNKDNFSVHLQNSKSTFLEMLGPELQGVKNETEAIRQELSKMEPFETSLKNSKQNLLDILAPQLGQLIKRSLVLEIDKINNRISNATDKFSISNIKHSILSSIGLKPKERLDLIEFPEIVDILIIDKDSGILLGKYSTEENADSDIIAGMFNAIKSFADTAFDQNDNELDLIHYNDFRIKLNTFGTIYYATIFKGRYTPEFQEILETDIDAFTEKIQTTILNNQNKDSITGELSDLMKIEFNRTCEKLEKRLSY